MQFVHIQAVNMAKKQSNMLRILVQEPQKAESRAQYVFTEFADDESFESALGMLEQLWEDSSAQKM